VAVLAITLKLKDHQLKRLKVRAKRAELPLEIYILAAASDPLKYAWSGDGDEPIAKVKC
jgi:hypothetical protein